MFCINYKYCLIYSVLYYSEEVVDVHSGDQHIMRYKPIAALISLLTLIV